MAYASTLRGYEYTLKDIQLGGQQFRVKQYNVTSPYTTDNTIWPQVILGNVALPFGINDIFVQYLSDIKPLRLPQLGTYGATGSLNSDRQIIINTVYNSEFQFTREPCVLEHTIGTDKQYLFYDLPSLIQLQQVFPIVPVYSLDIVRTIVDSFGIEHNINVEQLMQYGNVFNAGKNIELFVQVAGVQVDSLNTSAGSYRVSLQLIPMNMYITLYDDVIEINFLDVSANQKSRPARRLFYQSQLAAQKILEVRQKAVSKYTSTSQMHIGFQIDADYIARAMFSNFVQNFMPLLGNEFKEIDLATVDASVLQNVMSKQATIIGDSQAFNQQTRDLQTRYAKAVEQLKDIVNQKVNTLLTTDEASIQSVNVNVEYYNMFARIPMEASVMPLMQYVGSGGFSGTMSVQLSLNDATYSKTLQFIQTLFKLKDLVDTFVKANSDIMFISPLKVTGLLNFFGITNVFVRSVQLKSVEDQLSTFVLNIEFYQTNDMAFKEFQVRANPAVSKIASINELQNVAGLTRNVKSDVLSEIQRGVSNVRSKSELQTFENNTVAKALANAITKHIEQQYELIQQSISGKLVQKKLNQQRTQVTNFITQVIFADMLLVQALYFGLAQYLAAYVAYYNTAARVTFENLANAKRLYEISNPKPGQLSRKELAAFELFNQALQAETRGQQNSVNITSLDFTQHAYVESYQVANAVKHLGTQFTNIAGMFRQSVFATKYNNNIVHSLMSTLDLGILAQPLLIQLEGAKLITTSVPAGSGFSLDGRNTSVLNDAVLADISSVLADDFQLLRGFAQTSQLSSAVDRYKDNLQVLCAQAAQGLVNIARLAMLHDNILQIQAAITRLTQTNITWLPIDLSIFLRSLSLPLFLMQSAGRIYMNTSQVNQFMNSLTELTVGQSVNGRSQRAAANAVIRGLQPETWLATIQRYSLQEIISQVFVAQANGNTTIPREFVREYAFWFLKSYYSFLERLGNSKPDVIRNVVRSLTLFDSPMSQRLSSAVNQLYSLRQTVLRSILQFVVPEKIDTTADTNYSQHSSINYELPGYPVLDLDQFYIPTFESTKSQLKSYIMAQVTAAKGSLYNNKLIETAIRYGISHILNQQDKNAVQRAIGSRQNFTFTPPNVSKRLVQGQYDNLTIMQIEKIKQATGMLITPDINSVINDRTYVNERKTEVAQKLGTSTGHPSQVLSSPIAVLGENLPSDSNLDPTMRALVQAGREAANKLKSSDNKTLVTLTTIATVQDAAVKQMDRLQRTSQSIQSLTAWNNSVFMQLQDSGVFSNTLQNLVKDEVV